MTEMGLKITERDVQNAIVEALVWDGWMILRVNHGQQQQVGEQSWEIYWQALGMNAQDSGISDVIAVKAKPARAPQCAYHDLLWLLAIEVKAPGKGDKLLVVFNDPWREDGAAFRQLDKREKGQAMFLWAVQDHGGIAILADCLGDIADYLERIEAQ